MLTEKQQKIQRLLRPYAGKTTKEIVDVNHRVCMPTTHSFPGIFVRGLGPMVQERSGEWYKDLTSRLCTKPWGHSDPWFLEVLQAYLDEFESYSEPVTANEAVSDLLTDLSDRLRALMPEPEVHEWQFFPTLDGTGGPEAALKMCAKKHKETRRNKLLAWFDGFDGRSAGSLSANSYPLHRDGFHLAYDDAHVHFLPFPARHPYFSRTLNIRFDFSQTTPEEYINEYLEPIRNHLEKFSAFLAEDLVQGEGGMHIGRGDILKAVYEYCQSYGIPVILDAVQSGMGRTGTLFPFEQYGFVPDIVTLGKAFADGRPCGGAIAKKKWAFDKDGLHSNTNGGSAPEVIIASANLDRIRETGILKNVVELGKIIQAAFAGSTGVSLGSKELSYPGLLKTFEEVHNAQSIGLMAGVSFWDPQTKKPDKEFCQDVIDQAYAHRLLVLPCGSSGFRLTPGYTVSREWLSSALVILGKCIALVRDQRSRERARLVVSDETVKTA